MWGFNSVRTAATVDYSAPGPTAADRWRALAMLLYAGTSGGWLNGGGWWAGRASAGIQALPSLTGLVDPDKA